jgi:TatD DNase family protein
MLVDSHCHLDFSDFDEDRDSIIASAVDAGVGYMLTICTHVSKFGEVIAVAEKYDNIFCTVGVHPHNAESESEVNARQLINMAKHPKVVGFGETGLDFYYEHSSRDIQERLFRSHIKASRETGLPVIVHTRDADEDMERILRDEYKKGTFTGLIHCFSGGQELADAVLEIGFSISFSGIVTFKKAENIRSVAKSMQLNRILVETDSPYLAPVPMRGKRNEPAFSIFTAEHIADLRGMDRESFFQATTDNFFSLFTKAIPKIGLSDS